MVVRDFGSMGYLLDNNLMQANARLYVCGWLRTGTIPREIESRAAAIVSLGS